MQPPDFRKTGDQRPWLRPPDPLPLGICQLVSIQKQTVSARNTSSVAEKAGELAHSIGMFEFFEGFSLNLADPFASDGKILAHFL
jgi:hypothetical protein